MISEGLQPHFKPLA